MSKIYSLCCGRAKCPKLVVPNIKDDASVSDSEYYEIKDDFGGEVKLTLEQLQYLKNLIDKL